MLDEFNKICNALRTIPGLSVIETSEESTETEQTLPACIVDIDEGQISPFLESADSYHIKPQFSFVLYGAKNFSNKAQSRANLLATFKQVLGVLVGEFESIEYSGVYLATQDFGKGEAYAIGFLITLPEQEFDIS